MIFRRSLLIIKTVTNHSIKTQSRSIRVKCSRDGELPGGRRSFGRGVRIESRCNRRYLLLW